MIEPVIISKQLKDALLNGGESPAYNVPMMSSSRGLATVACSVSEEFKAKPSIAEFEKAGISEAEIRSSASTP
jgi:hypothetical protein